MRQDVIRNIVALIKSLGIEKEIFALLIVELKKT